MAAELPVPADLGLPAKYNQWRPNQSRACEAILESRSRFLMQVCPTGFGKSVTYTTAAQLMQGRTVILTSTKGLQSQLVNDFRGIVTDIRGKGNYQCRINSKVNCDEGMCSFGIKCAMKEDGGCFYYDQLRRALRSKVVVTNYAYWMSQNEYSEGMGEFGLMVLDEAHSAPDQVISHIEVSFSRKNPLETSILRLNESLPNDVLGWRVWADSKLDEVEAEKEQARLIRKEKRYSRILRIEKKLVRLAGVDHTWVWEDGGDQITISPTWPRAYSETALFLGVPRVLLTSATVVPKTAELLGIQEGELEVQEYPHSFPVQHRPLIHIPTVRMNYRIGPLEERQWMSRVDQIIRDRVGTKGIIHTVSYARRDAIMKQSKFRDVMISHSRRDTEQVVRDFKKAEAPLILVSPSMATGWDFPDDECRWQIIVKLPYPDTRGNIIKARSKQDPDFTAYLVMQQLIQACGRGVRSADDWCETFVTDNNITWFIIKNGHLAVNWFEEAYSAKTTIPRPMEVE